jgi:alpha-amylase
MSGSRALLGLVVTVFAAVMAAPAWAGGGHHDDDARHSLRAPVTGESFYFVMADRFENGSTANDRGGLSGDRLVTGFDPTARGFYQGGDLKGLLDRIDYIRGLGTTAIWLTPSFKNKAVQLEDGPSAGYHGYWITDFTQIDPHLGTNAELRALVDAAHARGMKVFFDIITNHTADVIGYEEGARRPYISKDDVPYRTAFGNPFDDRDYAGTGSFPPLDAEQSFPYTPVLDPAEQSLKFPAWLNDVRYYHNRGDTTFTGEDSYYGDFFGLDDLFTEHPRVVRGMIDIYKTWIRDMGIDGFRIDTMKHVDDEFWRAFAPEVLEFARRQGKREFFMFGEVFDTTKQFTSHFTTQDDVQAVIDFPFQDAARKFARSEPTAGLRDFFADDDWYTDADSNVYQLPTFLGNHDMGRIGSFVRSDNAGATDAELVARDRLAHELMYLSRGNPVVYYGDEQGFTGDGGDQLARQSMFASVTPDYLDDDLLGTTATHAQANFVTTHPLYRAIGDLARLTQQHDALRDGAQIHRLSAEEAGVYAFSRLDRRHPHEYVVALNNAESPKTVAVPTYDDRAWFDRVYGSGAGSLRTDSAGRLTVTVPALSAVVYRAEDHVPRSRRAPDVSVRLPGPNRDRLQVEAEVDGDSFYEVTFLARERHRGWRAIGTDDNAPYRVFHDVADERPGDRIEYKAVVLDNAGHTRTSRSRTATIAQPSITITTPAEGGNVRDEVLVTAAVVPEHADDVVTFERRVGSGPWTSIGRDSSSPVYTVRDDISFIEEDTTVSYRATLDGRVTSAVRTANVVAEAIETAIVHYNRPAGDYGSVEEGWGLHLWGTAIGIPETAWGDPFERLGDLDSFGAVYEIPIADDTARVNFIMHLPGRDDIPTGREPGGDRFFIPLDHPEIWLKQGDPAIYFSPPPG